MVRSWKFRHHIKARDRTKRISDFGGKIPTPLIPHEGNKFPIINIGDVVSRICCDRFPWKTERDGTGVKKRENCRGNFFLPEFCIRSLSFSLSLSLTHSLSLSLYISHSLALSLSFSLSLSLSPSLSLSLSHYKHKRRSTTYFLREIPVKNRERWDRSQQTGKLSG